MGEKFWLELGFGWLQWAACLHKCRTTDSFDHCSFSKVLVNSFHSFETATLFCIFKKDNNEERGAPNFYWAGGVQNGC